MSKKPYFIVAMIIILVFAASFSVYLRQKYGAPQAKHPTVLKLNLPPGGSISSTVATTTPRIYGEITRVDKALSQVEIKSKPIIWFQSFKPTESVWRVSTVTATIIKQINGGQSLPASANDLRVGQTVKVEYLNSKIDDKTSVITPLRITIFNFNQNK